MAEFERLRKFVELPKLPPSQLEDKMSESVQVMRRMLAQQDVDDKFSDGLRMSIEAIERARQDQERFRTELTFLATLFRIKDGRLVRVSGKLSEALDTVTRDLGLRPKARVVLKPWLVVALVFGPLKFFALSSSSSSFLGEVDHSWQGA
jgi:hypothetical protein